MDDVAAAAEIAADAAATAAEIAAAEPQPDPNAIIAADVAIAKEEEETKRARIAANAQVEIAELNAEEPAWLNDIRISLARMETRMEAIETRLSSTPQTSIVIADQQPEPQAEPQPEPSNPDAAEAGLEAVETNPEPAAPEPEPPAPPARQKPRWT